MPKFEIGDYVKFRGKEFEIPSVDGLSVKIDTDKFVGKVTGSIDQGPNGVDYFVDVDIHGVKWNIKVKEDKIISLKDYVLDMANEICKSVKDSFDMSEQACKEIDKMISDLRKGPEIKSRIQTPYSDMLDSFKMREHFLGTSNPKPGSWIQRMLDKFEKESMPSFEKILRDTTQKPISVGVDLVYAPMPKSKPESESENKMSKSRCLKLLESYRAEREKVRKGRRFERCLRECVVDEALERAIELLKGGIS